MPIGPHRTHTVPVNLRDLERVFDDGAKVGIEDLLEKGLIKNTRADVKVLANGELTKKLSVTAHRFSAAAREKITAAGGSATALREPADPRKKKTKRTKTTSEAPAEEPAGTEEPAETEDSTEA
jgi:hypothetical protein